MEYPEWFYYPLRSRPPDWVRDFVDVVAEQRAAIDSLEVGGRNSDFVLAQLRPGLEAMGFDVERGKRRADKISRPVLFGEQGTEKVTYQVDAFHDELGIALEVEAGRGAQSNAVHRDLIRASLIVDARFLALGVMRQYRSLSAARPTKTQSYASAARLLEAVYASGRLLLPFEGILLFGY